MRVNLKMKSNADEARGFLLWLRSFAVCAVASSRVTKPLGILGMFLLYLVAAVGLNVSALHCRENPGKIQSVLIHLAALNTMCSRYGPVQ
jgi:hypothetical protein